ncbi:MAG: hypothetical protein PHG95_02975 [Patescibacteria group bacterium]|nr:hypothetical protein [Patescibacteria group bacterium]
MEGRYQEANERDDWPSCPFIHYLHPDWQGGHNLSGGFSLFSKGVKWIKVDGAGNIVDRGINNNFRGEV